jgi:large subunit ribosomal protein L35
MPKMKTHKGTAKRFRTTGTGKLRRRQAGKQHLRLAKGKNRYRRLGGETVVAGGDAKLMKKLLGQ